MSRRTAEASKIIAAAWNNEKQLVLVGKGTRDWTPSQQQDIIDRGKAYDDNGKAFEGHHMKSVEKYPEYQGEPGNIQFLSRQEHQEAHGGNFQNPTNGYFNPLTKITKEFGDNPFEPCEVICLSEPQVVPYQEIIKDDNIEETTPESADEDIVEMEHSLPKTETTVKKTVKAMPTMPEKEFKKFVGNAVKFYERHQDIINLVLNMGGSLATGLIIHKAKIGGAPKKKVSSVKRVSVPQPAVNTETVKTIIDRATPIEHTVREHIRHVNGKEIVVKAYTRGKK